MPQQIVKRDGRVESWSVDRIAQAILKSLNASGIKDPILAKRLAGKVESKLEAEVMPEQELVQDTVEQVLMESRLYQVARRYIVYREKRRTIRSQTETFLDVTETIDSYLDKSDWRVSENANMAHSFQGLMLHLSGSVQARYSLEKYPEEVRQAHEHGYFHIHDLSFGLAGYCAGWSLRDLLLEGFNLEGRCSSGPPKHFDAALGQMVNFLGTLQNEWAGAQAFNNVDTYLAPLVRHDNLTYEEVKQAMQKFVFNLNTTSRWGGQSPFTNLTFDLAPPTHIASEAVIIGGTSAVSNAVESALKAKLGNANVERLAGDNRYETANKVAARVITLAGPGFAGDAFIATGANFPDSLAASPLAVAGKRPLYLVPTTATSVSALPGVVERVAILGSASAVNANIEASLKTKLGSSNVVRLGGNNRYETAVLIASYGVDNAGLSWDGVAIATGANFPDALGGGVLQGKTGSVMLLSDPKTLSSATRSALVAHASGIHEVRYFGSTAAVTQAVRDAIEAILE